MRYESIRLFHTYAEAVSVTLKRAHWSVASKGSVSHSGIKGCIIHIALQTIAEASHRPVNAGSSVKGYRWKPTSKCESRWLGFDLFGSVRV